MLQISKPYIIIPMYLGTYGFIIIYHREIVFSKYFNITFCIRKIMLTKHRRVIRELLFYNSIIMVTRFSFEADIILFYDVINVYILFCYSTLGCDHTRNHNIANNYYYYYYKYYYYWFV